MKWRPTAVETVNSEGHSCQQVHTETGAAAIVENQNANDAGSVTGSQRRHQYRSVKVVGERRAVVGDMNGSERLDEFWK